MQDLFLIISLYAAVFNSIIAPMNSQIGSLLGYAMLICFWAYSLFSLANRRQLNKQTGLIIVITVISFIFSANALINGLSVDFVISLVSFICFYLALSFPRRESNPGMLRHIYFVSVVFALWSLVALLGDFSFLYRTYGKYGDMLFTLGLSNPNGASVYALFVSLVFFVSLRTTQIQWKRWVSALGCIVMSLMILKLNSRTVLLCLIMCFICYIFKLYKKLGKRISTVIIFAPFVAFAIQVILGSSLRNYSFWGETLDTGRLLIFFEFFEDLDGDMMKILLGSLGNYTFENLHNSPLTIFSSIGILGLTAVYGFWIKKVRNISETTVTDMQKVAFMGTLAMNLASATESMTMVGTAPYSIFVVLMLKIAQGDFISDSEYFSESFEERQPQ